MVSPRSPPQGRRQIRFHGPGNLNLQVFLADLELNLNRSNLGNFEIIDELWSFKKNLLGFYSATSYKLRNSCEGTVVWLDANDNCLQVQLLKVWRAIPALSTLRNTRRKILAGLDGVFLQML